MLIYKYEMHAHTAGLSRCGKISPRELVRLYAGLGYAGICVTNHFGPPKQRTWDEHVQLMHSLYSQALEEGKKLGVDVFLGWEYSCSHAHDFLTYGLDAQWLYAHPEITEMNTQEYLQLARSSGGFAVHAHPFRELPDDSVCLRPHDVDAVEVLNTGRSDEVNRLAAQYAENYNLPCFAGSDTHSSSKERFAGISFAERPKDIHALLALFKSGKGEIFCL